MDQLALSASTDTRSVAGDLEAEQRNPVSHDPTKGEEAFADINATQSSSIDHRGARGNKGLSPDHTSQRELQEPWIRYRVEYKDPIEDRVIYSSTSHTPITEDSNTDIATVPVFELVTTYKAQSSGDQELPRFKGGQAEGSVPPLRDLGSAASYSILIYSTAIINAIQSVVAYYPSQKLTANPLKIEWPYRVLVHHYDDLVAFRKQVTLKSPENICVREKGAGEHLKMLLQFLDDAVMGGIRAESERNARGFRTYEHLWYAYRPGCVFLTSRLEDEASRWTAIVVSSVSGGPSPDANWPWRIDGWSLNFDGTYLDRIPNRFYVDDFPGESYFRSETHFIYDYTEIDDEEAQKLITHGEKYWDLVKKRCQYYKGKSCQFPFNEVSRFCRLLYLRCSFWIFPSLNSSLLITRQPRGLHALG